jgi:hypothetical protein
VTPLKGRVLVVTILAGSLATAEAKSATGIYLTADDYKNGRLRSESDCDSPGHKVELHDILNKPYIHVTHGGETRKYLKSDIYGFRTCDGRDYRFVGNGEYQILESKEVSILSFEVSRGRSRSHTYFFSVGAGGEVLPLTLQNLKRAFPNNHVFHDALDATFRADDELTRYDTFHKMFKVNRLLIASMDR